MELFATGKMIFICFAGSDDILEFLMTGLYAWLPDSEIHEIEDYTSRFSSSTVGVSTDMRLWRPDIYPINNFTRIKGETLSGIISALSELPEGDNMLLQLIVRPLKDSPWLHLSLAQARSKDKLVNVFRPRTWLKKGLPLESLKRIREKCSRHMLMANYRISAFTDLPHKAPAGARAEANTRLSAHIRKLADAVKTFDTVDENRFVMGRLETGAAALKKVAQRRFDKPYRMSPLELSTLFHPPLMGALPNTAYVLAKKSPPPKALPADKRDNDISLFGLSDFRDHKIPFGIRRFDRRRHLYILGKSGSGKSCLLQLLVQSDINKGHGCAVIDPHGDLIDDILRLIPKHRLNDVVIFDPSDTAFPASFNPVSPVNPELKVRVALSFLDAFKRVFGSDWSEKMDHVLRYAMLGLISAPGSTILSLRRMLSDEAFRTDIVRRASDESVKRFWLRDFVARRQEFEDGPISRLLNRLDELLSTEMMRNILGQSENLFDFRHFMDNGKIVLLKVSKGVLGADNASLLGSLLIWKMYEAAMSRADTPMENRKDFYLYVDEMQNFATESFGEILSESRKYRLCLTVAHQFLGQLPASIKNTVFGNVANLLSFRVGADDAGLIAQEFQPVFGSSDLLNLPLRNFYLKMSVNGEVQESFSGSTLNLVYPDAENNYSAEAIEQSRAQYCVPVVRAREQVQVNLGAAKKTAS